MSASPLRFASALSTHSETDAAIKEVCDKVLFGLQAKPDLAMLFFSHHHQPAFDRLGEEICTRLGTENLLGCCGESIVGTDRDGKGQEVEDGPAFSLWAASLPDVQAKPFALTFEPTPEGNSFFGWPDELIEEWPADAALLLLGEPFSFPADVLLARLNEDHAGTAVIGGMASGGSGPGGNALILGRNRLSEGAVAVVLQGNIQVRTVVSQGCRPIGEPLVITKAERNIIQELGGRPALARLRDIFQTLPTREQQMVQRGLHVGRVVSEYKPSFGQGDFLVRNVVGIDTEQGAIAIGDYVRPGQTVQFHIRDEKTADDDLRQLLAQARDDAAPAAEGALLFTCNGRGTRMFSGPNHDATCVGRALGEIPLAGFFAQGEIGPVAGKNFLHGFTASVAIFSRKSELANVS